MGEWVTWLVGFWSASWRSRVVELVNVLDCDFVVGTYQVLLSLALASGFPGSDSGSRPGRRHFRLLKSLLGWGAYHGNRRVLLGLVQDVEPESRHGCCGGNGPQKTIDD